MQVSWQIPEWQYMDALLRLLYFLNDGSLSVESNERRGLVERRRYEIVM